MECWACGRSGLIPFYRQSEIPFDSCRLFETKEEALNAPRGELDLRVCDGCGFIFNCAYDVAMQNPTASFEETQFHSPRFRSFCEDLVDRLVTRYGIREKRVLEIGCGQGDFLKMLCQRGKNHGVGVDPCLSDSVISREESNFIRWIKDSFPTDQYRFVPDAIICRHTLEHLHDVRPFVESLCQTAKRNPQALVMIEVPDVWRILKDGAFWDFYYEHCSYFTSGSLARLLRAEGLLVIDEWLGFDDQYIVAECRYGTGAAELQSTDLDSPASVVEAARKFQRSFVEQQQKWSEILQPKARSVVVWGSGSKSGAFLSAVGAARSVQFIVNINPDQQGKYVAGTGHRIVPPEFLTMHKPDLVISMNSIYTPEIHAQLTSLGVETEVVSV